MSRSRKRRNQQYAVSLFPFLAVLVCTLGVLIVMLVMAVQQADVESRDRNDEVAQQQQEQLRQVQDRRELAEFEADSIRSVRSDLTSRLSDAKNDRSYLEQQVKDTNRMAEDLLAKIAALSDLIRQRAAKEDKPADSAEMDAQLQRLKAEIAAAEKALEELRQDKSFETRNEYAIIPFTGSGGTHRQPIFIECVRDAIVLQPYNIKLEKKDFTAPLTIGNMLDSALLTVREYWQRHGLSGPDAKPYPLLIVRPDGAETYGLARRAMKSWDDEFGYELVDKDLPLRFGQVDLQLKSEIEAAVDEAKRRQQRLAQRRFLNRDDQWKEALQLARGLQPSASGGFETVGTGQSAYEAQKAREAFAPASFEKSTSPSTSSFDASLPDSAAAFERRDELRERNRKQQRKNLQDSQRGSARDGQRQQVDGNRQGSPQRGTPGGTQGNTQGSGDVGSLAASRGPNWALPAKQAGAKAYVRPIRLICEPHQISVVSQGVVTATVPFRNQTIASVDPLVSEIWKTIEIWGLAGRQAYWKPELKFSVLPGAERRFEELRILFDDSGLIVGGGDER